MDISVDISVVSATYNRAELLDNALHTYSKQKLPTGVRWEYLLVDDMSTDNTKVVVDKWIGKKLPIRYMTSEELGLPKKPGVWRDGCALRNRASARAQGRVIILTHPEIMVPPDALKCMYDSLMESKEIRPWVTAIPYWMPAGVLPKGWKTDLSAIRNMKGFYDPSWPDTAAAPGGVDYRNNNQEIRDSWESEVFGGFRMTDWRWFGGFREFTQWGSVDIDQMNRRRAAGFRTVFPKSEHSPHRNQVLMVYHQNHGSVRDMERAMEGVRGLTYNNVQQAREAGGLYPTYYHGPRERSIEPGTIKGIYGDHIARYKFAAIYAHGKNVLDIPCGTGYGVKVLFDNCPGIASYHGLDIDGESIDFASLHYGKPNAIFRQGDMLNISLPDNSVELLLCFEGIEHIEKQLQLVSEMHRVLREGGTFIISTPNGLVTPGTHWDKHVLKPDELYALFNDEYWTNLDWFHQLTYSVDEVRVQSGLNENAQIMILGGTKA